MEHQTRMSLLMALLISTCKQGRPMRFKRPHDVSRGRTRVVLHCTQLPGDLLLNYPSNKKNAGNVGTRASPYLYERFKVKIQNKALTSAHAKCHFLSDFCFRTVNVASTCNVCNYAHSICLGDLVNGLLGNSNTFHFCTEQT